jgi:hypothetical protein
MSANATLQVKRLVENGDGNEMDVGRHGLWVGSGENGAIVRPLKRLPSGPRSLKSRQFVAVGLRMLIIDSAST